jgi:hypothetical protein
MTEIQALNDDARAQGNLIGRIVAFLYGVTNGAFDRRRIQHSFK